MADLFDSNNASAPTRARTIFGTQYYNREPKRRDEMVKMALGETELTYMRPFGRYPQNVQFQSLIGIAPPKLDWGGPFAIADMPQVERKLPWERIVG